MIGSSKGYNITGYNLIVKQVVLKKESSSSSLYELTRFISLLCHSKDQARHCGIYIQHIFLLKTVLNHIFHMP